MNEVSRAERAFRTTRWSAILTAADTASPKPAKSLDYVCRVYWYPLYAHARRSAAHAEHAKDLVQGFFCDIIQRDALAHASPERGRFRSFLLKSFSHYISNQRRRDSAQKRGGHAEILAIDAEFGEECWCAEPCSNLSPDVLFDRRWAILILEFAVLRLKKEFEAEGRAEFFEMLRPHLFGDSAHAPYAEIARAAGVTVVAVKSVIHRLRARYRRLLRDEIARTVQDPSQVDDELRMLRAVLSDGLTPSHE